MFSASGTESLTDQWSKSRSSRETTVAANNEWFLWAHDHPLDVNHHVTHISRTVTRNILKDSALNGYSQTVALPGFGGRGHKT